MTETGLTAATQDIVVEDVLPFSPEAIWRALTSGALMARWMMEPTGFEAVVGNRFTFTTTPAGNWDGTIQCEVLDVVPHERFVYSWTGGDEANVGYGSRLETTVTWTLAAEGEGTRLKLVHAGFVLAKNDVAYKGMSGGWVICVDRLSGVAETPN
jgi:uncharacterized protein YndB with AHSA1/START domain